MLTSSGQIDWKVNPPLSIRRKRCIYLIFFSPHSFSLGAFISWFLVPFSCFLAMINQFLWHHWGESNALQVIYQLLFCALNFTSDIESGHRKKIHQQINVYACISIKVDWIWIQKAWKRLDDEAAWALSLLVNDSSNQATWQRSMESHSWAWMTCRPCCNIFQFPASHRRINSRAILEPRQRKNKKGKEENGGKGHSAS